MERYIIAIYTFSVFLSWFCLSLELYDQRNIFHKNEIRKINAFHFEIWNVEKLVPIKWNKILFTKTSICKKIRKHLTRTLG